MKNEKTKNKECVQKLIDRCKEFEIKAMALLAVNPNAGNEINVWLENVKKVRGELVEIL